MLRNKEFRQFVFLFFFMSAAAIMLGFAVSKSAGLLAIAITAAFGAVFFMFTKTRYNNIAKLSHQIDLVLHNEDHLDIAELNEGELSILHSEITKMTLRLREQNDALKKEKNRLANALADIAHQLRTPLTSANLILSLLKNSVDEQERKVFAREAEGLFVQMDWLLTSLLKISRLDGGVVVFQMAPLDVGNLINAALYPLLVPLELRDITLEIDVPQGIVIQGDAGWLAEAIQNILKNCLENAGSNGVIKVVCRDNPLFVALTIHDNGTGFAEEVLPRLFDRFYRGKSASAGNGIGLALCKMIITQQGGTVTAKNHPQGGAVFAIRFPK